jgi:hypothetical protein
MIAAVVGTVTRGTGCMLDHQLPGITDLIIDLAACFAIFDG